MRRHPRLDDAFLPESAARLESVANSLGNAIRLRVHGTHDKDGFRRGVASLFFYCRQVVVSQQLVAILVRNFLDPAELVEFRNRLESPSFAERFRRLLVVALLPDDFVDLRDLESRSFLEELEWLPRRDASRLPPVAHEQHAGSKGFGDFKDAQHVARTKLASLVDQDDAAACGLLHALV